jgi:hypothetical protein
MEAESPQQCLASMIGQQRQTVWLANGLAALVGAQQ